MAIKARVHLASRARTDPHLKHNSAGRTLSTDSEVGALSNGSALGIVPFDSVIVTYPCAIASQV